MKNAIIAGLLFGLAHGMSVPVNAEEQKLKKGFYSMDSMGCMITRECTKDVRRIKSIDDIRKEFPNSNFDLIADEFDSMLVSLDKIGVMVFLGAEKYFPVGHRGVYHTVSNNFYLNDAFMHRPHVLMTVMRHEGWHAAQDCMAGTIDNSMIAIIKPEEDVPKIWRDIVEKTYPKSAVPWEAEAKWAGKTEGMTSKALKSCAAGTMWTDYKPTPLTEKWLREEGFIN
jgi:hypothetical protein